MTTETACLSSVWCTDDTTKACLEVLGRGDDYRPMAPADGAYYDDLVEIPLDQVEPMIALPFHPSNAYTIREFKENAADLLHAVDEATLKQFELKNPPAPLTDKLKGGEFYVDQAVIAGCSGGTLAEPDAHRRDPEGSQHRRHGPSACPSIPPASPPSSIWPVTASWPT